MNKNAMILMDRIEKIYFTINKYGEDNFYLSFSGGKDSTVLSALIDMAIPNNEISRVFADTGIELNMIRDFVYEMAKIDERIEIIEPSVPIKQMLEQEGYPFKSKVHSSYLDMYQRTGITKSVHKYINKEYAGYNKQCPKILQYQFTKEFALKVSDKCCDRLKKDPLDKWKMEHDKPYGITGIMASEGGGRDKAKCLAFSGKKLKNFQPLVSITKEWEDWFIEKYNVNICNIYKEPYNFSRTGCKGCPFNIDLQNTLDTLKKYFPNEYKQCKAIWKPVYDEYRRLGYRLKQEA